MKVQPPIWFSLVLPALSGGALVGVVALWWQGAAAAVCVFAGCAVVAAGMCLMITRQTAMAQTQIRCPELRASARHHPGIYRSLLDDILERLEQHENHARRAIQAQTESEALLRVRQKQTQRLEAAFSSLPEPIFITDAFDEINFWNPASQDLFRQLLPVGADSTVTSGLRLDLLPAVRDLVTETRSRARSTRSRTLELELTIQNAPRSYRVKATNIYDDEQAALGVVVVLQDVGAEKAEKARHAEFVSSASHELKTPLASMRAFVEMLEDGDVDEDEEKEVYGFIAVQIDRLTRLINNMLNLARVESGVVKVQREDDGLNKVLEKSLEVVRPMADEKRISLIPELSELYLPVHIDPDLFSQAIINLLSNAVKYTPEGGEVRLRSRMNADEAVIEVRDNGLGIPPESLPRLFERFYRVPQNCQAAAGTGLGLALVQYIVSDVHNGRISVTSKVNEGSCFTVTIPLGHRHKPTKRRAEALAHCPT